MIIREAGRVAQVRAWALVPRSAKGPLHFVQVVVEEQFPELGGAYVYELRAGTGHFVPFSRLASTLSRARLVARQLVPAEKSATAQEAGAGPVKAAA